MIIKMTRTVTAEVGEYYDGHQIDSEDRTFAEGDEINAEVNFEGDEALVQLMDENGPHGVPQVVLPADSFEVVG